MKKERWKQDEKFYQYGFKCGVKQERARILNEIKDNLDENGFIFFEQIRDIINKQKIKEKDK